MGVSVFYVAPMEGCAGARSTDDRLDSNAESDDAGPCNGKQGCCDDLQCSDGFCDRTGMCMPIDNASRFGTSCKRPPELPSGVVNGKLSTCGAYLCIDGRCRSCLSDEECIIEYAAPHCRALPGLPGPQGSQRCGNYAAAAPSANSK